jgi:hypothetical protein
MRRASSTTKPAESRKASLARSLAVLRAAESKIHREMLKIIKLQGDLPDFRVAPGVTPLCSLLRELQQLKAKVGLLQFENRKLKSANAARRRANTKPRATAARAGGSHESKPLASDHLSQIAKSLKELSDYKHAEGRRAARVTPYSIGPGGH